MSPAFSGLGPTVGTYAERLSIASPQIGQLFYQTDTDEYLKYVTYGGASRWMQAALKPNRNMLINGSGTVAQRSASSVALTTSVAYGSVDRWAAYQATSAAGTISKITTSLPTAAANNIAFGSGFRIGRNASATNTGTIAVVQALETVNSVGAAGNRVTLSFWAKAGANYSSSANGLFAIIQSGTGTDQAANGGGGWTGNAFPANTTLTLTSSWAFYSVTGIVASNATQLEVILAYAPVGTAGADDNVYITGVQLEVGSAPSEFEFEPFETTLRKCQRYYQQYTSTSLRGVASAAAAIHRTAFVLPVTMRTAPASFSLTGAQFWNGSSSGTFSSANASFLTPNIVEFDIIVTGSSWTAGQAISQYQNSTTQWFSAEL